MKLPETIQEFLSFYPEEIILAWLKSGQKTAQTKRGRKKRAFGRKEAQEKMREKSPEEIEKMVQEYRKKGAK